MHLQLFQFTHDSDLRILILCLLDVTLRMQLRLSSGKWAQSKELDPNTSETWQHPDLNPNFVVWSVSKSLSRPKQMQ